MGGYKGRVKADYEIDKIGDLVRRIV